MGAAGAGIALGSGTASADTSTSGVSIAKAEEYDSTDAIRQAFREYAPPVLSELSDRNIFRADTVDALDGITVANRLGSTEAVIPVVIRDGSEEHIQLTARRETDTHLITIIVMPEKETALASVEQKDNVMPEKETALAPVEQKDNGKTFSVTSSDVTTNSYYKYPCTDKWCFNKRLYNIVKCDNVVFGFDYCRKVGTGCGCGIR
jgi:long-subunit fatty acid transport protein